MTKSECLVKGCVSSRVDQTHVQYFPIPMDDPDRRKKWLEAAGQSSAPDDAKICKFHFIGGRPSDDPSDPDYVPALNLFVNSPDLKQIKTIRSVDELNHWFKKSNEKLYGDYQPPKGKMSAKSHGFKRNLKPEKIIGIIEIKDGQRCFLVKWKNNSKPDFVNLAEANEKCPDVVINFYESLIEFTD